MTLRTKNLAMLAGAVLLSSGQAFAGTTPPSIAATINGAERAAPVSPYLYGMFIEPIGPLVARTLWAEMLDDRKFYFPVQTRAKDVAPPRENVGPVRMALQKWRPIGGDDAVTMDTARPFVGAQSPRVTLSGASPRGLSQNGLGVVKGKRYVGHLWLDGVASADVTVSLVWGDGRDDRETVELAAPGGEWQRRDFAFEPRLDSANARLEIVGTGGGHFRVAAISLMPADNVNGWRADTTALAASLKSGFWRLPGGNFLSNWDWHEAIGDRDRRPPMFDHAWSAMQANDLGMDEWLDLCRILGAEPYITVNAGLGDAHSAADEVEYVNGPASSYWGGKRAANGHAEPYKVRFWNIGNEPYGKWQIGVTSLEYYIIKHNQFAAAMRAVDPSITLLASGAMPDQEHSPEAKTNLTIEEVKPLLGTEQDWTGGLLRGAYGSFSGLTEHWYDSAEQRPAVPADIELIEWTRSPSNHVRMKAEEWALYQQQFPRMKDDGVFLSIDEYAYFGEPNLKLALAYGLVFQEMLRHSDFLKMAAFTTGASTMDITPTKAVLNATGLVFQLYGAHFGAGTVPLQLSGSAPQPAPQFPVGANHPRVRAGSPTYPLDVVAGLSADGKTLKIGVVNPTFSPRTLRLDWTGLKVGRGRGQRWLLSASSLMANNAVGVPPRIAVTQQAQPPLGHMLSVPATAAAIYEFPLD